MVIAILASQQQRDELLTKNIQAEIVWADSLRVLSAVEANVYIDLQFRYDRERIERLQRLLPAPVIVNAVTLTLSDLPAGFTRINGWHTMLQRSIAERVTGKGVDKEKLDRVFDLLGWKSQEVPDIVGMIAPRIIASIVNEAYFTFESGVSSREEIDTAMELGTNYPEGPFKWSEQIGLVNIYELLYELERNDERYAICHLLEKEAKELKKI